MFKHKYILQADAYYLQFSSAFNKCVIFFITHNVLVTWSYLDQWFSTEGLGAQSGLRNNSQWATSRAGQKLIQI